MSITSTTIGFLGAGQMATALAGGFISSNSVSGDQIFAYDHLEVARKRFSENTRANSVDSAAELIQKSQLIFLAVKPQHLPDLAKEISSLLKPEQTIISIAAGVTLSQLNLFLDGKENLIRIMPNTPCLVGEGAAGLATAAGVSEETTQLVMQLMQSVGSCEQVPEKLLDAVTGLSGSGPAYVFQFIEALSDGGVFAGLPRATATKLAAQTVLGAAKMVLETGQHPGELKDAVTSPGGTTIAGLAALERNGFRSAAIEAVVAATKRSQELCEN
ncbi:MAG TPA: pyrroline-5-carboxylate reductase [Planctomycetaceae bacterium]|nr:pyrroline-5-carboxylate reductase [Planctomycetaceae bacterium]